VFPAKTTPLPSQVRLPFVAALIRVLLVAVAPGCTEQPPSSSEACTQLTQSPGHADTVAIRQQVLGADCGLFPAAAGLPTDEEGQVTAHCGRFTPTLPQVVPVELALRTLPLHRVPVVAGHHIIPSYPLLIHQNLPRYKRQYFGFYDLRHQPCLYVHFFAASVDEHPGYTPRWLREVIQVEDGGAGYWSVKYNLTTHQFYDFEHNSEG